MMGPQFSTGTGTGTGTMTGTRLLSKTWNGTSLGTISFLVPGTDPELRPWQKPKTKYC